MIKAVVFDMFETLVSLFTCPCYTGTEIAADLGLDETVFRSIWNPSEADRACGKQTVEEVIEQAMRTFSHFDEAFLTTILERRTAAIQNSFQTYRPDIPTMLRALHDRGLKIALITNCYFEERDVIVKSELFQYFDVTCMSCEEGLIKPDPRIFDCCLERLGLQASECLYVGDGGSSELQAAQSIGMKPCQATWYITSDPRQPVGRLSEFPEAAQPMNVLDYV